MKVLTSIYLAFIMLFGGLLISYSPVLFAVFCGFICIIALIAIIIPNKSLPVLIGPAVLYAIAFFVSFFANLDIFPENMGALILVFSSFCVLILFSRVDKDQTIDHIYYAGWLWLVGWLLLSLLGWKDHKNLVSVWPIFISIAILAKGKPWPLILPFVVIPFLVRGRAGIIGLAVALVVYIIYHHWQKLSLKKILLFSSLSFVFVIGLLLWRVGTVTERLVYWNQAIQAWLKHDVWFGLGPQGLYARYVIEGGGWNPITFIPNSIGSRFFQELLSAEPMGEYLPHAHNIIVQIISEFGIVGFALTAAAVIWIIKLKPRGRWQLAIIAGMMAFSMFDHPLYNPGPLIMFTIVAASLQTASTEFQVEKNKNLSLAVDRGTLIEGIASTNS